MARSAGRRCAAIRSPPPCPHPPWPRTPRPTAPTGSDRAAMAQRCTRRRIRPAGGRRRDDRLPGLRRVGLRHRRRVRGRRRRDGVTGEIMARMAWKTVVVTGGGSGIGAACAHRLGREGANLVVADINPAKGQSVAAEVGPSARFVALDVRDEAAWRSLLADLRAQGGVHGLVNAAGVAHVEDTLDGCTRAVWDFTM